MELETRSHLQLAMQALERYQIGYLLVDRQLAVVAGNELIYRWSSARLPVSAGLPVMEFFPELIGVENDLRGLFQDGQTFAIRQITRFAPEQPDAYFDLQIGRAEHFPDLLLLTALDVTIQTLHQRRIQQQRNERQLLAAELTLVNEQLTFLFKRFVPEPIALELMASRRIPQLGSETEREATILFADMRGFTGLAEHMAPDAVLDLLNEYLGVVAEAILRHDGMLVQVVGDMVMGVFNLPAAQTDHARRAIAASVDIQQSMRRHMAAKVKTEVKLPTGFGIGISTGHVVAGFLGLKQRYRYAVVGDTTNVAFYLCSQAAAGHIVLCESTLKALARAGHTLPAITFTPLGQVWPKRRSQAVNIYALAESANGSE